MTTSRMRAGWLVPCRVALNVELAEQLRHEPYGADGRGSGYNRNGSYPKTVTTEIGQVEVQMQRDRLGTFEPAAIPKHLRRLDGKSATSSRCLPRG